MTELDSPSASLCRVIDWLCAPGKGACMLAVISDFAIERKRGFINS